MTEGQTAALIATANAVAQTAQGNVLGAGASLMAAALSLVPIDVAQQLLTDEQVRRANLIADLAEIGKFSGP